MEMTDIDVAAAFTKYYMTQSTMEFSEDLDRIRGGDDFKEDALPLLVKALQQGTALFSVEEQRTVAAAKSERRV